MRLFMVYSIGLVMMSISPQGARIIATVREIDTGKAVFVRCWAGTMPASGFFVGDVAGNVAATFFRKKSYRPLFIKRFSKSGGEKL